MSDLLGRPRLQIPAPVLTASPCFIAIYILFIQYCTLFTFTMFIISQENSYVKGFFNHGWTRMQNLFTKGREGYKSKAPRGSIHFACHFADEVLMFKP